MANFVKWYLSCWLSDGKEAKREKEKKTIKTVSFAWMRCNTYLINGLTEEKQQKKTKDKCLS